MKTGFSAGRLSWSTSLLTAKDIVSEYLSGKIWPDGYLAFSAEEKRLGADGQKMLEACMSGRSDASGGPEGYLMEAGLWRTEGKNYEEIALERDGENFSVQYWRLETGVEEEQADCYYRKANAFIRGNLTRVFDSPPGVYEIVVPQHRLRIYLTTEVSK